MIDRKKFDEIRHKFGEQTPRQKALAAIGVAVVFGLLLYSCTDSAIEGAVRENLKDPGSARFGDKVVSNDGNRACLEWSAKNGFGGYGDQEIAVLKKTNGTWSIKDMTGTSASCGDLAFEIADARDTAESNADARFEELLASTPQFSNQSAYDLMHGTGACADAVWKYRSAREDDAEYSVRVKEGDYSENIHGGLKDGIKKAAQIESIIKSGSCEAWRIE